LLFPPIPDTQIYLPSIGLSGDRVIGRSELQNHRSIGFGFSMTRASDHPMTRYYLGELMSKKTGVVVVFLGMCALSMLIASCGNSSNRPAGLLYVISQAENNISSFAIDLNNGGLSLINSNLTPTCPPSTTCGIPLSISLDPTGATAFVLNQQSISGYTIGSDGDLSAPTGGITLSPTQTALAMTRDAAGAFLFLISVDTSVPAPTDCPDPNTGVFGSDCPTISVFTTSPGSTTVTPVSSLPLSRVPTALTVITFTPHGGSAGTLLFVTSDLDLTSNHNDNQLSVFAMDSGGALTEQPNSPYTAQPGPTSVLAVNTNPVGQATGGIFVYAGSQNGSSSPAAVSGFLVCSQVTSGTNGCSTQDVTNNLLIPLDTTTMASCQAPTAMLADPTNSFLYILCNVSSNVYGFHMITGTGALTALTPPLVPTGASPVAMAMHPNFNAGAEFLFISNLSGSTITGFNLAVTTGALSSPQTVLFLPGEPAGIAAR
jgi:hypothetical protein